uniref:Uncharacterized protein n=1 Tax=Knipowitschia caucasica TaxID=637954 RepID=A0AAV2KX96_KNICA
MAIHRASMENRIALPLGQRNGEVDNRLHFYKDGQGFIVNSKRKFELHQSLILTDETPKKQVTVPQGNTAPKPKSVKQRHSPTAVSCRWLKDNLVRSALPQAAQAALHRIKPGD